MKDQEIIDNAPEGATHYDCDEYMRHVHDGEWEYWSKAAGWEETTPQGDTRSLADIKRIVELEEERRDDYSEASTYATSLFNTYYKSKPDAVNFELCTSVAAIITQIDNMATGVISELEKELSDSQTQGDRALSVRDLRQQAKGVEDFFKSHKPRISMGKSAIWEVDDVLVDEALAALKEQVK